MKRSHLCLMISQTVLLMWAASASAEKPDIEQPITIKMNSTIIPESQRTNPYTHIMQMECPSYKLEGDFVIRGEYYDTNHVDKGGGAGYITTDVYKGEQLATPLTLTDTTTNTKYLASIVGNGTIYTNADGTLQGALNNVWIYGYTLDSSGKPIHPNGVILKGSAPINFSAAADKENSISTFRMSGPCENPNALKRPN